MNSIKNLESLKKNSKKYIFNSTVISPPVVQVVCPETAQLFKEYFLNQTCAIPNNILSDNNYARQHLCAQTMLLICNMLSVSLLFKAPLGQTCEMLSFYNYNLVKIHFYLICFKHLQGNFALATPLHVWC